MNELVLDDCHVDLLRQRVTRGEESWPLTTMERRLLAHLGARPNTLVSRDELLQEVWEYGPGVRTHTVRTTVNRLRAKLERDPSSPRHLQTVRGRGYRLIYTPEPGSDVGDPPREEPKEPPTNLVYHTGAFVGRTEPLAYLRDAMRRPGALVTLLGPGGIGKTTLARHYARTELDSLSGGTWFCDLSHAHTARDVNVTVAKTLGVPATDHDLTQAIATSLRHRGDTLLILDNLEQLCDEAVTGMQAWRVRAPATRILATSRHRLGVEGEQVLPLDVLSPDEACDLYVERARELAPAFGTDGARTAALDRLVRALECIPLAIELAAARATVLSPEDLLQRLESLDHVLRSRRRDRPPRQQTMQATLELSWELLQPHEQDALSQISVFHGGFRLAAAEAVLSHEPGPQAVWIGDLLQDLHDKSWLRVVETACGIRFTLLKITRAFASNKLLQRAGPDGVTAIQRRHALYFATEYPARGYSDVPRAPLAEAQAQADLENLSAAKQAAHQHGWTDEAARLALAVWDIGAYAMTVGERHHAVRVIRQMPGHTETHLASLLLCEGVCANFAGASDAMAVLQQALEITRRLDEPRRLGIVLREIGNLNRVHGKTTLAVEQFKQALSIHQDSGDVSQQGIDLAYLGLAYDRLGQWDEARDHCLEALKLLRRSKHDPAEAMTLNNLASLQFKMGDIDGARRSFTQALDLLRKQGNRLGTTRTAGNFAILDAHVGNLDQSIRRTKKAIDSYRMLGDAAAEARGLNHLGGYLAQLGELDEARELFTRALAAHREMGDHNEAERSRVNLANIDRNQGRFREATDGYRACLEAVEALGDAHQRVYILCGLAAIQYQQGDLEGAEQTLRQAIELSDTRWPLRTAVARSQLALLEAHRGKHDTAAELLASCTQPIHRGSVFEQAEFWLIGAQVAHLSGDTRRMRAALDTVRGHIAVLGALPTSPVVVELNRIEGSRDTA